MGNAQAELLYPTKDLENAIFNRFECERTSAFTGICKSPYIQEAKFFGFSEQRNPEKRNNHYAAHESRFYARGNGGRQGG